MLPEQINDVNLQIAEEKFDEALEFVCLNPRNSTNRDRFARSLEELIRVYIRIALTKHMEAYHDH